MSRLVAAVVQGARDRHVTFDADRHPSGPLYRWLASYVEELTGKIAALDTTSAVPTATITATLPLADFNAGIPLTVGGAPIRRVLEVIALDPATAQFPQSYSIPLIDKAARYAANGPVRAVWQDGATLYLRGPDIRWIPFGSIQVTVELVLTTATAVALQASGAALPLPDEATRCVEDALALFMAQRTGDPALVGTFGPVASASETAFLSSILDNRIGREMFVQDDYRP